MKKKLVSVFIFFLNFSCSAAQVERLQTFTFGNEKTAITVKRECCEHFAALKSILDDVYASDDTKNKNIPISLAHCSKEDFIILSNYVTEERQNREAFLQRIPFTQRSSLLKTVHTLKLTNTNFLYTDLLDYALVHFTTKQLEECIDYMDRTTIKTILKKMQINALAQESSPKRNLKHGENLDEEKCTFIKERGFFNFEISMQDFIDSQTTKPLLTPRNQNNIIVLTLSNRFINSLKGIKAIPNLASLQNFFLDANTIKEFSADTFEGFSALQQLYLMNNQIQLLEPRSFPSLSQLQILRLDRNKITAIPSDLFATVPQLQQLNFAHNQIETLQLTTFTNMPNLQELDLSHNAITALEPAIFEGLQSLRILNLAHNQITTIDPRFFCNLPQLQKLNLAHNPLQDPQIILPFCWHKTIKTTLALYSAGLAALKFSPLAINNVTTLWTAAGSLLGAAAVVTHYNKQKPLNIREMIRDALPETCEQIF